MEQGEVNDIQQGILGAADHTLLYPDPKLLQRFKEANPDTENVTVIEEHELPRWLDALETILHELGITPPG